MKIAKGSVVGIDYSLHLGDGEVVDRSEPGDPLMYLQGEGQLVPGLESALEGLGVGDQKQVVVPPADGYGEHDARGVLDVTAPPDAEVLVDGRRVSRGSVKAELWEGAHRIEVRLGAARAEERFTLSPGETWTYAVTPTQPSP